jgi:glycine/D-amino acid oxidase-like deaminating enzyme
VTAGAGEFGVWGATAPPLSPLPSLAGPLHADIAIVGAGYTGLSTALHLAERGLPCVVLEAREPGWGASGRSTGWLEPHWWMKRPSEIRAMFGEPLASELTRWVANGPQLLERWIGRYALDVAIDDRGLLLASDRPAKAAALAAEAAEWRALGVDHDYVEADALPRYVGASGYLGALALRNGLTLNPLALCRELARAAVTHGAQVFVDSPATALARSGDRWRVDTPRGQLTARRLVLATDAYTRALWPQLERTYATWHAAVVASEPYPAIDEILPAGHAFADLGLSNIFTLRRAGRRLVTATLAPVRRTLPPAEVAAPFARKFARLFPQLPAPRWAYRHYGEIGISRDAMVRLCQIGPDAWTAYGYSGTGINMALLLGEQLADLAATGAQREPAFPLTDLEPLPLRGAVSFGLRYVHAPLVRHVVSRFA